MYSDKIAEILEKQLKTLGQKIRIDILKKLDNSKQSIPFAMLQKEVLGRNSSSVNFTFHLKALKKIDVIDTSEEGYFITSLGNKILTSISSIEKILNEESKTIMIRTSKYSKEPFNANKIEEYLMEEGELEEFLAKKIAQEVIDRLLRAKINYLTAPLVREYINGILIENGLEEVRHKLTRLGTPPYDVLKIFNSRLNKTTPEKFIKKLGSDVSEQFLLLNLLPNDLADLYISGDIDLINLNYWALRPLSLCINMETIFDIISRKHAIFPKKIDTTRDLVKLIFYFDKVLSSIKPLISEDIVLGDFNSKFLSLFESVKKEKVSFLLDTTISQILEQNISNEERKRQFSLEFSYKAGEISSSSQFYIDNLFFKKLNNRYNNSLILLDYLNIKPSIFSDIFLNELNFNNFRKNLIFNNNKSSNLINSTIVKVSNSPNIILDKISINLHKISLSSNQNDDLFYDLLQDRLSSVFKLFKHKESLLNTKLNHLNEWTYFISQLGGNSKDWSKNSIKSVSFFGLNEAVKYHCNIELDRINTSESFSLKILSLIKELIEEKNEKENEKYVLSQPHYDIYLKNVYNSETKSFNKNLYCYSPRIIKENSKLDLNKKISLFKKFERIINGGTIFKTEFSPNILSLEEHFKTLYNSKLNTFSIH